MKGTDKYEYVLDHQKVKLNVQCKCPDVRKQLQVQMSTHSAEYDLLWSH